MRIRAEDLTDKIAAIFEKMGCPTEEARLVSDSLVQANLRGHDSHGVGLVATYIRHFEKGFESGHRNLAGSWVDDDLLHRDGPGAQPLELSCDLPGRDPRKCGHRPADGEEESDQDEERTPAAVSAGQGTRRSVFFRHIDCLSFLYNANASFPGDLPIVGKVLREKPRRVGY
jgi:hypothetical protein